MNNNEYLKKWLEINDKMILNGFTWGSLLENDEWNQYMSFDVYKMNKELWDNINQATKDIGNIYQKTYEYVFNNFKYLQKLGLPIGTMELSKIYSKLFSYFTRMDLIVKDNQIKVIEVNCDTPTGYLETSICNKMICAENGYESFNNLEKNIQKSWEQIIKEYDIPKYETIFFTSYGWHEEDKRTTQFIQKYCDHITEYIPLDELYVAEDGIFTPDGRRINYLYRLYPIEYLCDDVDENENGKKIGQMFIDHIINGNIKIINPPSAFIMQSKAIMAIIWELYESKNSVFSKEELIIIKRHFLPTYFTSDKFNDGYVSKPIFGREGGGVSIINDGELIEDDTSYYYNQKKIYQQYIEMPDEEINTWDGVYKGKLLIGSFLINNEPSGLFLRVGEKITGNLSMFKGITVV